MLPAAGAGAGNAMLPAAGALAGASARAACRVDLAGGTVDMWPLYLFHPGAVVVNIAIEVMTCCKIVPTEGTGIELVSLDTGLTDSFADMRALREAGRYRHALAAHLLRFFYSGSEPASGLRMETHSESPAGAGISGSSALMIASTAALARFTGRRLTAEQIREIAQNVEAQLIGVPTGCQDYYPALYGGVNAVQLDVDGIHRQAIECDADELDQRLVLAYTGAPRKSGINNWEVFKRHIDGERRIFRNFERIGEIARAMRGAVESSDWGETGRLLREEWKLRRTNAPAIATEYIDRLIAIGRRHGALGAKVCGAGGGGCVLFMTSPETRGRVEQKLTEAGARLLPSKVARHGVKVRALKAWDTQDAAKDAAEGGSQGDGGVAARRRGRSPR
jgi:D-glycero-alpha-D-manno-heptose-7-phosphate kinase